MSSETVGGSLVDSSLIGRTIRYYALIGIGIGSLGLILLGLFGGGSGFGAALVTGFLFLSVVMFTVLSGPIIAALVSHAVGIERAGGGRSRFMTGAIANGVGFAVLGAIVFVFLLTASALFLSSGGGGGGAGGGTGGGGGGGSNPITLAILLLAMVIPNALVGGGITYSLRW
jgi:hypothetical protein